MKRLLIALIFVWFAAAAQAQVRFETKSTDAVREIAIKQKKLVFIALYEVSCEHCRNMDRKVFSKQEVGEFMQSRFVSAKYDIDEWPGSELMKRYGNGSVPAFLIFNTQGEWLGRIVGESNADKFMEYVQSLIDKYK